MRTALWRFSLWAGTSLILLACALYGFLWLPYQRPEENEPELIELLPTEVPGDESSDSALDAYVWRDREAGIVSIPVTVAMRLMASRLPVAEPAAGELEPGPPGRIPTDAGSGRFPGNPVEQVTPVSPGAEPPPQ